MSHDIEQHNAAPSPTRRTVLAGAAWSVPVIAAASIAPVASASGTTTLTFDKSTYNGTACGTITGAYVTVTVNGVATAGKSVTTTLSNGYKFSDGTTTNTQVSGSNGRVSLPAINVPAVGGSGAVYAVCGQGTTTATVSAPSVRDVGLEIDNSYFPALPAGVTATSVGLSYSNGYYGYFLGSD
ncbi:MAG: hypothetical protein K0S70_4321, partial [Microbacterium sp.]|nr:hypothetical protein [Microbacterium sp.]